MEFKLSVSLALQLDVPSWKSFCGSAAAQLRGDLYRQGREIGRVWTGDPEGYRTNLPATQDIAEYALALSASQIILLVDLANGQEDDVPI